MASVEEMLHTLPDLPISPSPGDIAAHKEKLLHIREYVRRLDRRLGAEFDLLYSICPHTDKRHYTCMGEDSASCRTCGKTLW